MRDQTFVAHFLGVSVFDTAVKYPRITDGMGKGIIEEVSPDVLAQRVKNIKKRGASDELYHPLDADVYVPWDVRDYDIDSDNARLHSRISLFEDQYSTK